MAKLIVTAPFVYRFPTGGRIRITPVYDDEGEPKAQTLKREVVEAALAKGFGYDPDAADPAADQHPDKEDAKDGDGDVPARELASGDGGEGGPAGDGDDLLADSGGDGAAAGSDG